MTAIADTLDQLRILLGETEALAAVTAEAFDRAEWEDCDPLYVDRMASLLGLLLKSATGAMDAFHRLHGAVAGEEWDYDAGTASGE